MLIFVGVPPTGGVKRPWGCRHTGRHRVDCELMHSLSSV